MFRHFTKTSVCILLLMLLLDDTALTQTRNALVIGNAAYRSVAALKMPAADASIVAETLRAAGYDVTELHDIRKTNIGQSMRGFLDEVSASGPAGVVIFYYSGYAAQSNGGERLLHNIERADDVPR